MTRYLSPSLLPETIISIPLSESLIILKLFFEWISSNSLFTLWIDTSNNCEDILLTISLLSIFWITKKIKILEHSLKSDFNIPEPKIAILGINPHAGDYGVIGEEEETFLSPLVKAQHNKGIRIYGPFPADGFFGSQSYQNFDAVLAIYHDQGLIPFKTLSFGEGVNFTAGLDRVRTSPDHGTAYDIAGQGMANHNSFKKALHTAREIFLNRKKFNDAVN